jgi:hypothetical protein
MRRAEKLHEEYLTVRAQSALATAADARYAPFLFNTLSSLHSRFPTHPTVYVYDLGMNRAQRQELATVPWLEVHPIEPYVPHWKANWSWKPYLLTQVPKRYVLYFDSANFVVFRPLELWFLAIKRHGYFVISNNQKMSDVTPTDYFEAFGISQAEFGNHLTFGAGLFGFDNESPGGEAIREALKYTKDGWGLGCSAKERSPHFDRSVTRDCPCFRADQTLFNLAMRKRFGASLFVRNERRYCGFWNPNDHPRQFLWYSRRQRESLTYYWQPLGSRNMVFWYNRLPAYAKNEFWHHARKLRDATRLLRGTR